VRESGQVPAERFAEVVGRISFFVNSGVRFVEEMCKMRAFGQLWDRVTSERYGVTDPKARRFRYGVQVNSLGLTEAQPENNVQRPLWASTGTKNPSYSDVKYVDELIGPETVTTLPLATLEAFQDHGRVARTIDLNVDDAHQTIARLEAVGIAMKDVTDKLLADGITSFGDALERLERAIGEKHRALCA
jgi:transaldolase